MHTQQPLLLTWLGQTAGSAAGPQGGRRPGQPACRRHHRQQSRRPGPGRVRSGNRCSGGRQGQAEQGLDGRHPPASPTSTPSPPSAELQLTANALPSSAASPAPANLICQPSPCQTSAASPPAPGGSVLPRRWHQTRQPAGCPCCRKHSRHPARGSDEARQVGRDRNAVSMMPDVGVGSPQGCMYRFHKRPIRAGKPA